MSSLIKKDIDKKANNGVYSKFENVYNASDEIITKLIAECLKNGKEIEVRDFISHKLQEYEETRNMFYKHDAESHIVISLLENDLSGLLNFFKCAHNAGMDVSSYFRCVAAWEYVIESDLDSKFKTHPALKPHIYKQLLEVNRLVGKSTADHWVNALTDDSKSINENYATDILGFYAKEIDAANGDVQKIENLMCKVADWFKLPTNYSEYEDNQYNRFLVSMRSIINALPDKDAKQKRFLQKILEYKNHLITRKREQTLKSNREFFDKTKCFKVVLEVMDYDQGEEFKPFWLKFGEGTRFDSLQEYGFDLSAEDCEIDTWDDLKGFVQADDLKYGKKLEDTRSKIYDRYMQPLNNYETNYNKFLASIDTSENLNYDQIFKDMDAVEKEFSLSSIQATLEGRR